MVRTQFRVRDGDGGAGGRGGAVQPLGAGHQRAVSGAGGFLHPQTGIAALEQEARAGP